MLSSVTLSLLFTIVFALTGAYSLARVTVPGAVGPGVADRVAELSHVLMSIGMIAMLWGWTGGRDRPSGIVQIVVFGLYGVWFLARLITGTSRYAEVSNTYHAVTAAAMVWMVLTMPTLDAGMSGMSGMAGMPDMAAMDMGGTGSGTATTATVVTSAFVVLLAAAAVLWAVRAARADPCADDGRSPVTTSSRAALLAGPRLDGCCHLLVSLGMGGLLLAML